MSEEIEKVTAAIEWFNRFNAPHPTFNEPCVTRAIVARGAIPTLRQARWLGFAISPGEIHAVRGQRPSREEWQKHVRIMASLRGLTEAEADAQCRMEVSDNQRPE